MKGHDQCHPPPRSSTLADDCCQQKRRRGIHVAEKKHHPKHGWTCGLVEVEKNGKWSGQKIGDGNSYRVHKYFVRRCLIWMFRVTYPNPVGTFESMTFWLSHLVGYVMFVPWRVLLLCFAGASLVTIQFDQTFVWTTDWINYHDPLPWLNDQIEYMIGELPFDQPCYMALFPGGTVPFTRFFHDAWWIFPHWTFHWPPRFKVHWIPLYLENPRGRI